MAKCKACGEPLEVAQKARGGQYKSCPNCSQENGKEHVFYPLKDFGTTEHRITGNNPDGIQSWCQDCRGRGSNAKKGITCSNI